MYESWERDKNVLIFGAIGIVLITAACLIVGFAYRSILEPAIITAILCDLIIVALTLLRYFGIIGKKDRDSNDHFDFIVAIANVICSLFDR